MTRRLAFANNGYYHVYNRGTEQRNIFIDDADRLYFLECLLRNQEGKNGEQRVHIMSYVLMTNHFHLLFEQQTDRGISNFMHDVSLGYAMYFNTKYERTGRLYSGTYKAKVINSDAYLLHISRYIHLNPLDIFQPGWKKNGVTNKASADLFLKNYRWSSYRHFLGLIHDPIVEPGILADMFDDSIDYQQFLNDWIGNRD